MAKIVVTGYMIRYPMAGMMYTYFHYVLGLSLLGHDVTYVEESGWSSSCFDPATGLHSDDPTPGLRALDVLMKKHDVSVPAFYVRRDTGAVFGGAGEGLRAALEEADVILNLGGVCWLPEFRLARRLVLVDMDPPFTQFGSFARNSLHDHDVYFSYGTNIGKAGCRVPDLGIEWHPMVPPVVMEAWSSEDHRQADLAVHRELRFTTIANWTAYGEVEFGGEVYGQKDREFLKLIDLPDRVEQGLEIAVAGADDRTKAALVAAGWVVSDALTISKDVDRYREYILGSRGEFSVAKHGYVKSRSGWFSERSVCYLASGRPVILQDTGYTEWLPADLGVLSFETIDDAASRLRELDREYARHQTGAREIARDFFDHRVTLPKMLEIAAG